MSSNYFLAFIVALSSSTWMYFKIIHPHTMDTKRSLTLALMVWVLVFFVMSIVFNAVIKPAAV